MAEKKDSNIKARVFRLFFDSKGQMSAPFELLVAVIIMGFVIIIGTQMMTLANQQMCLNTVTKEMTEFKMNLEDTVNRKSSQQFDFRPEKCFEDSKTLINIEKISGQNGALKCSSKCGQPSDTCFVMTFATTSIPNGFVEKCLNLPEFTSFVGTDLCPTEEDALDGYEGIKPEEGIGLGSYILRNISSSAEPFPKICVYHRP